MSLVRSLGGNAAVPAIYDVRYGITLAAGAVSQWDDARGAAGFGPSLVQVTAGKRPVWDVAALTATFDGVDDDMTTAASALFDISGDYSIILIGALTNLAANGWSAGIADAAAPTRALRLRSQPTGGVIGCQVVAAFAQSTVITSATRRLLIGSKVAATSDAFADVPKTARVTTAAAGVLAAGANTLTIGAFFTGSLSPAPLVARALLCLTRQVTVADIATLLAWSQAAHGVTAA